MLGILDRYFMDRLTAVLLTTLGKQLGSRKWALGCYLACLLDLWMDGWKRRLEVRGVEWSGVEEGVRMVCMDVSGRVHMDK